MSNSNGKVAIRWIAIIVSVVIASVSLSLGVIRTSQADRINDIQAMARANQEKVQELKESNAAITTEIQYIRREIDEINRKLDIILERSK